MALRFRREDDAVEEMHEINVTPFIDVILVLLIIFMVAAPLATADVPVDLPVTTVQAQPRPEKPIYLTVGRDLGLAVGDAPVARESLATVLDAASNGDRDQRVFVRADRSVSYGDVMDVMNALRAAGYLKIGLVALEGGEGR